MIVGRAGRLVVVVLLAATLAAASRPASPAGALSCSVMVRKHVRVCMCIVDNQSVARPMLWCRLSR